MIRPRRAAVASGVLATALGAGCSQLPTQVDRPVSVAMRDTGDTRLGRAVTGLRADKSSQSAFFPLGNGLDAFVARLALAVAAERSIDLQTYLFHDDDTGRQLAGHLMQAADRGVRVRILIDDMDLAGRDAGLAALAAHPNISIRLFNPFPSRRMRTLDFLTHFGTVTRRMHNKSFTADNQATIVGGRNIGDEYFEAAEGTNFGDMDVLAMGPIVGEVSDGFDMYWNSPLAYPVQALGAQPSERSLEQARERLGETVARLPETPFGKRLRSARLTRQLEAGELTLYWGESRLLIDRPEKVVTAPEDRSTHLGPELDELFAAVDHDLILVSPYFVPGRQGTEELVALVRNGVRVTVLTNSLAATDVPAVHAGYARYRHALIAGGVELYEMRPTETTGAPKPRRQGDSQASLHAKTMAFDRERVLVGSMNLDPRSMLLNTEMGILIESPTLAGEMARWRDESLPEVAWRVDLEPVGDAAAPGASRERRLVWISRENGREVRRTDHDPEAGFWARLQAFMLSLLPIERQL